MKIFSVLLFSLFFSGFINGSESISKLPESCYIFTYFKGNGEGGLHLIWSADGPEFKPVNNDRSLLHPTAGISTLMRDPSLCRIPDGIFHIGWTSGWNKTNIGYSDSSDLINGSKQQTFEVIQGVSSTSNCWAPEIIFDPIERSFLIFGASRVPDRYAIPENQPHGPYKHRIYYTTTKDFTCI